MNSYIFGQREALHRKQNKNTLRYYEGNSDWCHITSPFTLLCTDSTYLRSYAYAVLHFLQVQGARRNPGLAREVTSTPLARSQSKTKL
jgi:hypothetical protein